MLIIIAQQMRVRPLRPPGDGHHQQATEQGEGQKAGIAAQQSHLVRQISVMGKLEATMPQKTSDPRGNRVARAIARQAISVGRARI